MHRLAFVLIFMGFLCAVKSAAAQQILPAGTSIDNQAGVMFSPLGRKDTLTIYSNTVHAHIREYKELRLKPDHYRKQRKGQVLTFRHGIENTGNVPATVTLLAVNAPNDDFDFETIELVTDSAETRQDIRTVMPGASQLNLLTETLQPGESFRFQVRARIPGTADPGNRGIINVQAKTNDGASVMQRTEMVEVLRGPDIAVHKEAISTKMAQGQPVLYKITGTNSGDQAARAFKVHIDGSVQKKMLIRDKVPVNTTFLRYDAAPGGTIIFHAKSAEKDKFTSKRPEDLSSIDEFAVAYDSLAPGQKVNVQFAVTVNENAAGQIKNRAQVQYLDPPNGKNQRKTKITNLVKKELPAYEASLHYYYDDGYNSRSYTKRLGETLYLQANASQCNIQASSRDTTDITLSSRHTGDRESVRAVETGSNTGYFRITPNILTADAAKHTVKQNNGRLETQKNDVIIATMPRCAEQTDLLSAEIQIAPYGIIFNSKTGSPVANARITLIDVDKNAPADVFDTDGERKAKNPQITAANGQFNFPYVKPGTYRIKVKPPAGMKFISSVSVQKLPPNRTADAEISYGKPFKITGDPVPVAYNVPLDPAGQGKLFLQKKASVTTARIGDFITYRIKVFNNASSIVRNVRVKDTLPFGFRFEKSTARLNDKPIDDPEGGKGPQLQFNIGDIKANSAAELTYRVLLGSGVRNGHATNTAVAKADGGIEIESNVAQNTVDVRGGVFTDKGYIIGKVYVDRNENKVQDLGEKGVPGVRLYLENGNYVITDSEGKYTFYGIVPTMHIVKLDNYSLPKGSKLGALDNRQAGDASSRFVDLKKGQLHRADFVICNYSAKLQKRITARRKSYHLRAGDEVGTSLDRNFNATDQRSDRRVKRANASGIIGGQMSSDQKSEQTADLQVKAVQAGTHTDSSTAVGDRALERAMVYEKAELGFMRLQNDDTLHVSQIRIWTKSKMGAHTELRLNGSAIGDNRIGKHARLASKNLQAREYIGIKLSPGKNELTLTAKDAFGNPRGRKHIVVYAAGKIDQIKLRVIKNDVPADGSSSAVVKVQLQDQSGIPVHARVPVTLDATKGAWLLQDRDPHTPGLQTFVDKGTAVFNLQSPIKPQDVQVRVSVGSLQSEATVIFLPNLRPLIAAGIIQGTIRLNDGASIVPARSVDRFEQELKSLSYGSGNTTADARAAFFLKGKIKGNMLLTAGFNSEKNNDQLFRDIQPDKFYPVYGESSVKGYDAQSSSRLYVRVDRKKTYALYGDFLTQHASPAKSLGEYNRTQTGIKLHYEKNWGRLNFFGSQATSLQRVQYIRGRGISGPYQLNADHILVNSEQIEIVTRNRNQPSIIIDRQKLQRFRDYVIEPFTGNLIFKSPVRGLDENLNPIYIRATYEVEGGGDSYLIGGADGAIKVTDFWQFGGSWVEDRNPENKYHLKSINSTLKLSKNTTLIGEVAESTTELDGSGRGGRLELNHRGDVVDGRLYAGQTDKNFVNRSSQLGRGRTEAGARGSIKVTSSTDIRGEFIYSSNDTLHNSTTGGVLNIDQKFTKNVQVEAGFRYSRQNQSVNGSASGEDITNKNVRGKLTLGIPMMDAASLYGEYEQNIEKRNRRLIAAGGDYKVHGLGRVYARHEFISSAVGPYDLNSKKRRQNTVFGFDADFLNNGKVYSEYRVDDAFNGQDAQAAIGIKNRFKITEGLGVDASFERIFSIFGNPSEEGTSISTAADYVGDPRWKATARAEVRFGKDRNNYLNTLGYGRKINTNWTFLGKNILSMQTSSGEDTRARIQQRLRLGFAYRQTAQNRWDALGRYEIKYEQNGRTGDEYQRLVHIFSSNVNFHPGAKWSHTARLAAKKVGESSAVFDSKSLTVLLSGRSMYDITQKLDGGITASMMSDAGFGAKDYGAGAELGYLVHRNLRMAVGFNVFGFEDRDLAASKYTRKGIYLGFSYKFDERLFRGLMPDDDKHKQLYETCSACNSPTVISVKTLVAPAVQFNGLQPVPLPPVRWNESFWPATGLPGNVHFASDESALQPASMRELDRLALWLKLQEDQFTLEIIGHTDHGGSLKYNVGLSQRRAEAVRSYLVQRGISGDSLWVIGRGEGPDDRRGSEDPITRALKRQVNLQLDIPGLSMRLIPQLNDLQVGHHLGISLSNWDYIFNMDINAVPDCIHMKGSTLNATTKYILNRILLALKNYPEQTVTFKIAGLKKAIQKNVLASFLRQAGADMNRIKIKIIGGPRPSHGKVTIDYDSRSQFKVISQRDDLRLAGTATIRPILHEMINLLQKRQDYVLITKKE